MGSRTRNEVSLFKLNVLKLGAHPTHKHQTTVADFWVTSEEGNLRVGKVLFFLLVYRVTAWTGAELTLESFYFEAHSHRFTGTLHYLQTETKEVSQIRVAHLPSTISHTCQRQVRLT